MRFGSTESPAQVTSGGGAPRPRLAMSRGAASSGPRLRPPGRPDLPSDASTLGVSWINVGMLNEQIQDAKVAELAGWVKEWLNEWEDAVVGINELHPTIATKLVKRLEVGADAFNVGIATSDSNSLLWHVCVCV